MVGDRVLERALARQQRHEIVLEAAQPHALAERVGVVLDAELPAKRARDRAGRCALVEADMLRGGVVAGREAPKHAVLDDGRRGRGRDAHVLEVLDMDRRHAAERRVGNVDMRVAAVREAQGRGLVADVRDDADEVAQVERARLFRDVGRGEAVMQERPHRRREILAEHLAGIVVEEAVDHHAVVAGDAAKLRRGDPAELFERRGVLESGRNGLDLAEQHAAGPGGFLGRFEFDHDAGFGAVGAGVEGLVIGRTEFTEIDRWAVGRDRLGAEREVAPDDVLQPLALPVGEAEPDFDVARDRDQLKARRVGDKKKPVRLDGCRRVDRLAIARGQVKSVHAQMIPIVDPRPRGSYGTRDHR